MAGERERAHQMNEKGRVRNNIYFFTYYVFLNIQFIEREKKKNIYRKRYHMRFIWLILNGRRKKKLHYHPVGSARALIYNIQYTAVLFTNDTNTQQARVSRYKILSIQFNCLPQ